MKLYLLLRDKEIFRNAFDNTQVQVAKAPVTPIMCQANEPIGYATIITAELCLTVITSKTYVKRLAS